MPEPALCKPHKRAFDDHVRYPHLVKRCYALSGIYDLRRMAQARLPRAVFDYLDGGDVRSRAYCYWARMGTDGEVKDPELRTVLTDYMQEFRDHVARVLTVLPRD